MIVYIGDKYHLYYNDLQKLGTLCIWLLPLLQASVGLVYAAAAVTVFFWK